MAYTAAVITISDKGFRGERVDTSGPAICGIVKDKGWDVVYTSIIPDEKDQISAELIRCADELGVNLVLTTGGTGFSPRDVTPEATLEVIERATPGIGEAMRAESMRITPRGCLSRSQSGIRGRTLIINLPGSEKAARENLMAVIDAVEHGLEMLLGSGSADCGQPVGHDPGHHEHDHHDPDHHDHDHGDHNHADAETTCGDAADECKASAMSDHSEHMTCCAPCKKESPSMDQWLREAKADPSASMVGMYLTHNGVVRETARAQVRGGDENAPLVIGMHFSYDKEKVDAAIKEAYKLEGIYYVRVWLNEGELAVGDDIMYVLIGGDIRPHVVDALNFLVGRIKSECVEEQEQH
jgi:molybdopterin adenylyltransferase